jgi:HAD superfamily hydrolase (TIGR01509 family)
MIETRFKAVIFDLDGLLLDTEVLSKRAWIIAAKKFGYIITDNLYEKVIGITETETMKIFVDSLGNDFPAKKINEQRLQIIDEMMEEEGVNKKQGYNQLIDYLAKRKIKKAIATSSNYQIAIKKMKMAGIFNDFDYLSTGDKVEKGKPEPHIFLNAAKGLEIEPKQCIAFEDSDDGTTAATTAGMKVIIVPDLKEPSQDSRNKAHMVIKNLEEGIALIDELI